MGTETETPSREVTPNTALSTSTLIPAAATANSSSTAAATANSIPTPSNVSYKRVLEDYHSPSIPSPLNPDVRSISKAQPQPTDDMPPKRSKKDTLKKRESKGVDGNRLTPDPKPNKQGQTLASAPGDGVQSGPLRYKLPNAKQTDFDPPRGPVFIHHHSILALDGDDKVDFFETSDQ